MQSKSLDTRQSGNPDPAVQSTQPHWPLLEFIRSAAACLSPKDGHVAILVADPAGKAAHRIFCSCTSGAFAKCAHARDAVASFESYRSAHGNLLPSEHFGKSFWYRLFGPLIAADPIAARRIKILPGGGVDRRSASITGSEGAVLAEYRAPEDSLARLGSRMGTREGESRSVSRLDALDRARGFCLSETEKQLFAAGAVSRRRKEEDGFWYTLAYHLHREYEERATLSAAFDGNPCRLRIDIHSPDSNHACTIFVPDDSVPTMLREIVAATPIARDFAVSSDASELFFHVSISPDGKTIRFDPTVAPVDAQRKIPLTDLSIFGQWCYDPADKSLRGLSEASLRLLATGWGSPREVDAAGLSQFLEENSAVFSLDRKDAANGTVQVDLFVESGGGNFDRIVGMPVVATIDTVRADAGAIDRDWCWLSMTYQTGTATLSLAEVLKAKRQNRRYLAAGNRIIDCMSPQLESVPLDLDAADEGGAFRLSRIALIRLHAQTGGAFTINTDGPDRESLDAMLNLAPAQPVRAIRGLKARLRDYQKNGVAWLLFLFDNNFGGLLCDDMGLGKTHQIMAFLLAAHQQREDRRAALVVCPTTVISHWERLVNTFAPSLKPITYHGSDREFEEIKSGHHVIVTSYGVLRNDLEHLVTLDLMALVLDEAHCLKNAGIRAHAAARRINARIKIGMTGTPVENSAADLRSLMNLVLPGYFGGGETFSRQFMSGGTTPNERERKRLRAAISPFIMRRIKSAVLKELPPKIEDTRTCRLSEEQASLYREALEKRAQALLIQIENDSEPVPYVHIFALLDFLKQICNHPSLAAGRPLEFEKFQSGKWDLFTEIMDESLGSGNKTVVFTNYLGMTEMIAAYLDAKKVGHAVLTGKSRDRGRLIERFNRDEECRVFVGSLRAGGLGIDLTCASVVIHYDRWWNAAREDQATDRVHRHGQTRCVQVFKLITEGTLEEKIDAIISRKRQLAADVIAKDSPEAVKSLSREELISLMKMT